MKLKEIEKAVYRKHLNIIIVSFIASLLILALAYGQGLIVLFTEPDSVNLASGTEEGNNNFRYNLLGVVLALITCALALHKLRTSAFFAEVYYVWQLKQQQNFIYRKLKSIKAAAENDDVNALIILSFYYTSLKQVYLLDDNTLTLSTLNRDISELSTRIANKQLTITSEQYNKTLLADF